MVQVLIPTTAEQLDQVRALMRAFVAWHRQRHQQDLALIDAYFDAPAFEAELAGLPGKYAWPRGQLLLAMADGQPAGCVALREIDSTRCEMKRMFVYPDRQGHGIGRALGEAILRDARAMGYQSMLLDTSIRQTEAQALYRRLGFRDVTPYYDLPEALRNWLLFMELPLQV
jgi:GNAT superfamily N-acetyltransferase